MYLKKIALIIGLNTIISGMAMANSNEIIKKIYACDENKVMEVIYINTEKNNYAIINQMDEMIPMQIMKMASGANYEAINKNYTYRLYTKGNKADLIGDKDEKILSNCRLD